MNSDNHFNDELRAEHGITTSQYEFLRYLRDHEGTRSTDMAAEFAIGVGAADRVLRSLRAALERDGRGTPIG